jgi:hypothetical protein
MVAITLPPFVDRFMDWVKLNPALGAVVILLSVVFLLWLVRKSLKFFMVALILLGITILGSYYYYGPAKTNNAVKRGAEHAFERGKDFMDKALQETVPPNGGASEPSASPKSESGEQPETTGDEPVTVLPEGASDGL